MKQIPLSQGEVLKLDDDDYEKLKSGGFYLHRGKANCYAKNKHSQYIHRLILGLKKGDKRIVDHINHDGLDCQKSNLRIVTSTQNCMNRVSKRGATSKYIGVYFDKKCNNWRSSVGLKGKNIYMGCFKTQEAAAKARDIKAMEIYGEYANLNFPLPQNPTNI